MQFKKIHSSEWGQYKDGILFIEQEVFSVSEFINTPEHIGYIAKNPRAIFILAESNELVVGDTYGLSIEDEVRYQTNLTKVDEMLVSYLRGFPSFGKSNTIYVASTALLPEFRNRGFAIELKKLFIAEAKNSGYKLMTGFVNKMSLKLNLRFGARIIHTIPNWIGDETYYQYYIKL